MLEISNVNVYDLKESVIASGNAMRVEPVEYTDEEFEKGLIRCKKLVNASKKGQVKCHDNFLIGIRVSFDIKYPQYWTPEFQRYHFADIVTSSSKMHRLTQMDIKKCCNKYVDTKVIDNLNYWIDQYNWAKGLSDVARIRYSTQNDEIIEGKDNIIYYFFMKVISNCPLGLELFMRVSTNYKQLQTIYYQRKNHKLKEDWGTFIKFIEELPYFKTLILGEDNEI